MSKNRWHKKKVYWDKSFESYEIYRAFKADKSFYKITRFNSEESDIRYMFGVLEVLQKNFRPTRWKIELIASPVQKIEEQNISGVEHG